MLSDNVKKGATRCAHRSLFHANGFGPEDLHKPLVGICNSFNEIIPGHIHLREIAEAAKLGVAAAGGPVLRFISGPKKARENTHDENSFIKTARLFATKSARRM